MSISLTNLAKTPAAPLGVRFDRWLARAARVVEFMFNRDFDCGPAAKRYEAWLKRPIVALSALLVTGAALAVVVNPAALVAPAALVVVIAVGYIWPWLAIRGVSAALQFEHRRGVEGEAARATVRVRNSWPWPVWGISIEGDMGGRAVLTLAHLAARSTTEFSWDCVPGCRGELPRGAVDIATGFPFGIVSARRPVRVDRPLLVWPATVPLHSLLEAAETSAGETRFSARRPGDAGDVIATRPFRQGDQLRRVHWALTARMGTLIACDRQAAVSSSVHVMLDVDRLAAEPAASSPALDAAIRIAATICQAYQRHDAGVECFLGSERVDLAAGQQGRVAFLDALARYAPARASSRRVAAGRPTRRPSDGVPITITTPAGLEAARRASAAGEHLLIVVETGESRPAATEAPAATVRVMHLGCDIDGLADFGRRWGRLRHAS